ncbi:hypothetical protein R0J87_22440, partial [Halomonas sp. SIMBA_159]
MKVIESHQFAGHHENDLAIYLAEKELKSSVTAARIIKTLAKYQKTWLDGFPYYFLSTKELHNARQFVVSKELMERIQQLS